MSKKNGAVAEAGTGESKVSLTEKYQGQTKLLNTAFPPAWEPATPGEQVKAIYTALVMVPKGPKVEKEFPSYHLKLQEWTTGVGFKRQATAITAATGLVFSISGKVMDAAMETIEPGAVIILTYNGLGEKKKGRSQAKLIEVHQVS